MSSEKNIRVLLIESDQEKAILAQKVLAELACDVIHMADESVSILREVSRINPDLILMGTELPSPELIDCLDLISKHKPKPVIVFSEKDDEETITSILKSGVSAYVIGDVDAERLRSVVKVALARFEDYQSIKSELKEAQEKLGNQKSIDKAKRWLMDTKQLSEKDAYHRMRKAAMDNGQKMEEVAKNILSMASLLDS
ncbi:ANTAR domain-containing response regulator [Pseudoteredinibacter isoporae]|uniref:Response regulator NasT n=1 Tax=Pseudoteredinibacter isoporae TaxID=570281 RepID=A0A7X0JPC0_9GAMM|nr:ANTAR domain-containing protein [Pseudoteredinibacter isoporae]MBB6519819.1 response regulator NasT [Pseudoteredinibacter isoporae]NHO85399.1 ANTAR domain-containing protein [Pseudoteredinibacter isoporae]NIB26149.1 ANTAR domain-containing protein [Pseudoteredinibacter isoporae]